MLEEEPHITTARTSTALLVLKLPTDIDRACERFQNHQAPYIYPIKILKYRVKGNFAVDLKYQSFVFFCGGCKFCLGERLDEEIYIGGETKKVKRNHEERNKNIIECCRVGW